MIALEQRLACSRALASVGLFSTTSAHSLCEQKLLGVVRARYISTKSSSISLRGRYISEAQSKPRRFNVLGWQYRYSSNIAPQIPTGSQPPPRRYVKRLLATVGLFAIFFPLGVYMSAGNTIMQTVNEMQNIPTDEETLSLANLEPDDPAHEVNSNILNHPLAKALFNDAKFSASRPHLKIPPSLRQQSFTAGTLMGPEMLPVTPLVFATKDGTELVQIQYVGSALCGHPGLVHGGMLATLLDEGLARCCFPGLPNKVGVTASLKVDYRTPCKAGQYVVLRAETTKFEGRKAWVKGRLETLPPDGSQGDLLVEAEALFIEPRNAAILARQRKIVGGDE